MYMQRKHIVCGKLHIRHDLVLDQNANNNAYSTPLSHGALDVEHRMVMLGIGLYHNTFSLIFVYHQNYPEHNTLWLSIFATGSFTVFYLINDSMFTMLLRYMILGLFIHTDIIVLCGRMHYNMWIKCFWSWKLNIRNWLIFIALVSGIDTINHLFYM